MGEVATPLPPATLGSRLRKWWGDHVYRSSESVMVECRPEWMRAGAGDHPGLTFATAEAGDDIPSLGPWLARRRAAFERMRDAGKLGVFVLRDGVAVGCAWLAFSDHRDRQSREFYRVRPGEAYHYCWLVAPEERARGTTLALCRRLVQLLAARGITRQFGIVDRDNRASYLVQRHFGYRECGVRVRHFHLLHQRWTRVSAYEGTLGLSAAGTARRRG